MLLASTVMTIDVDAVRADTPGCAGPLAYLNNAGSALPTQRTLDTMTDHLALEARVGGYEAAAIAAEALAAVRISAARLVNGAADEKSPGTISARPSRRWVLRSAERAFLPTATRRRCRKVRASRNARSDRRPVLVAHLA